VVDAAGDLDDVIELGLNCCEGPAGLRDVLGSIAEARGSTWAMPSAGVPTPGDTDQPRWPMRDPEVWWSASRESIDGIPLTALGGCCGTTPATIATIAAT
jgi:methionine synthase I (cobalamin-dependent)